MTGVKDLKKKWLNFKNERLFNAYFKHGEQHFMTVLQREKLIDTLFKYIEGMENA